MLSRRLWMLPSRRSISQRHITSAELTKFAATNEQTKGYLPSSDERKELENKLTYYLNTCTDIPIVIGDEELHSKDIRFQVMPFEHKKTVAKFSFADKRLIQRAIDTATAAQKTWERKGFEERAEIFLKAAQLMKTKYRMDLLATTMLGQGKTVYQAEIDAACELIDFLHFNVQFAWAALSYKPISANSISNKLLHRGMEGFWAAIAPFNFTAIGGNLSSAPAIAGNAVLWKPSDTAVLSNYTVFKIFREAGLPPGVINFVPSEGPVFGNTVTSSALLAGINFTGSVPTFESIWKQVGNNISNFNGFPRLIGECGGKNFHLVHSSADIESVVNGTLRSAFEYGGQKCSACSRLFLPQSISEQVIERLVSTHKEMKLGSPLDYDTFLSAVIDDKSFKRIKSYIDHAKSSASCKVLAGGKCDDSIGYYIEPTIVLCTDPSDRLFTEEIFGPVLAIYVYPDNEANAILAHIDKSTKYALTGAIFCRDEKVIAEWSDLLRFSAGNFYVNDKCTGAVVGQQPFGGARKSGTNDKAGGPHYMLRFMSPQSVKTNTAPLTQLIYPYMKK